MGRIAALLLALSQAIGLRPSVALSQAMAGASDKQNNSERTDSPKSRTAAVKIAAHIPNTSISELARPIYPDDFHIDGKVLVRVKIDRAGDVVSARAISGHPLLKSLAVDAAHKSKFRRNSARGPRYVTGTITYAFAFPEAPDSDLRSQIGQQVTLRGKFSLRGKVGPFVLVRGRPVYLVARGSFSWGQAYSAMEGKIVSVTGTLRFYEAPLEPQPVDNTRARLPDYFYFEAETARVQMEKPHRSIQEPRKNSVK